MHDSYSFKLIESINQVIVSSNERNLK